MEKAKEKVNEEVMFNIIHLSKFVSAVITGLNTVGYLGVNKKDKDYYECNKFNILLQSNFLIQMTKEVFYIFMSNSNKVTDYKEEKLALKYLSLLSIPTTINHLSYMVYDSPASDLTNFLLNSDLKENGIISETITKTGDRLVFVNWREYIASVKILTQYFKERIIEKQKTKKVGDKDEITN